MRAVAELGAGLPVIGQGKRAILHRLADGRVLKLYHPAVAPSLVEAEFQHTRAAVAAGLPSWSVDEVVEAGSRFALVGGFVEGSRVSDVMRARPWWTSRLLLSLAAIQARLHAVTPGPAMPARMHDPARVKSHLTRQPAAIADLVQREVLAADAQGFCHGDFHGGNVLAGPRGLTVIDWDRAGRGPLAADVARTLTWLNLGPTGSRPIGVLELAFRRWLTETYLAEYCRLTGSPARPIRAWLMFEIIRRRRRAGYTAVLQRYLERLAEMLA